MKNPYLDVVIIKRWLLLVDEIDVPKNAPVVILADELIVFQKIIVVPEYKPATVRFSKTIFFDVADRIIAMIDYVMKN